MNPQHARNAVAKSAVRPLKRVAKRVLPHRLRAALNVLAGRVPLPPPPPHSRPAAETRIPAPPDLPVPPPPAPFPPETDSAPAPLDPRELVQPSRDALVQLWTRPGPRPDVFVLPVIDWGFRHQRPQHLAKRLAQDGRRVFHFRTTFRPPGPLDTRDDSAFKPLAERLLEITLPRPQAQAQPEPAPDPNIYRDAPSPEHLDAWERACAEIVERFDVGEAVLLVQLPFWRPLAERLRQRFAWPVVYDCMDRHSGFSTNTPDMLREEERLAREADLVLATARLLERDLRPLNPNVLLLPNGCEYEHFAPADHPRRELPLPPDDRDVLDQLVGPVVGYHGAVSDWFDTNLLAEVARLRPRLNFVLVGSTYGADLAPLQDLPNVKLLGERPYGRLPALLARFDAAVIPFRINPLTEATHPVKFFEYLAAAKPVVATPMPELLPHAQNPELVRIAESPQAFARALDLALEPRANALEPREQRRALARANTWDARHAELRDALDRLFPKVSVVVLAHNNLRLNRLCVESLLRDSDWPDLEILLVDNASDDGTPEYFRALERDHPRVRALLHDRNLGFAAGNNRALEQASGEYMILLNNDTLVTRGWVGRLLRHLRRDPRVGMVGPVTNAIDNEARVPVDYRDLPSLARHAARRRAAPTDRVRPFPIPVLALFCAAFRRELLDRVGYLDERFEVGMFEDDDYSRRIRDAGLELLCAPDVLVHHFQKQSFNLLGDQAYLDVFDRNRARFEEKWKNAWNQHLHAQNWSRPGEA